MATFFEMKGELLNLSSFDMISKEENHLPGEQKRYCIVFFKISTLPNHSGLVEVYRINYKNKTTRTRWYNKLVRRAYKNYTL